MTRAIAAVFDQTRWSFRGRNMHVDIWNQVGNQKKLYCVNLYYYSRVRVMWKAEYKVTIITVWGVAVVSNKH